MRFLALPAEIILLIAEKLEMEKDIYSLLRTNSKLYRLLLPRLYQHNVEHSAGSALPWCITHGNVKAVTMLLRMGVPFKVSGAFLPSTSDFAEDYGFDEDHGSALHFATSPTMARLLLENGADVNELSDCWRTPLHMAVENRDLAMAKMLLDNRADVNARGDEYIDPYIFYATPLHYNLNCDIDEVYFPMTKLLVERGADLTMMDNRDETPLLIAVENGSYSTINFLLKHDALANAPNPGGQTPLHRASFRGNVAVAKLLLDHGASVTSIDRLGRSPLHEAFETKNLAMVQLLREYGA